MTPIDTLFDHMDRWRHLPAYQLERRADLFFSAYLPTVLAHHSGVAIAPDVLPELPLRRDLLWPARRSHASVKVDYAAFACDRSKVFFVELKTDRASRRHSQDAYLARSVQVGFRRIVQGIVAISRKSKARQKYGHLLHTLADHGCVKLPAGFDAHLWPEVRPGVDRQLQQVEVTVSDDEFAIEVVYVQPEGNGHDAVIDFETFAAHVDGWGDPVSQRFARSLRRWIAPAGTAPRPPAPRRPRVK